METWVQATVDAVDGDRWTMIFQGWNALGNWMAQNVGRYTGVNAKQMTGGLEHDNGGIDPRITRTGRG